MKTSCALLVLVSHLGSPVCILFLYAKHISQAHLLVEAETLLIPSPAASTSWGSGVQAESVYSSCHIHLGLLGMGCWCGLAFHQLLAGMQVGHETVHLASRACPKSRHHSGIREDGSHVRVLLCLSLLQGYCFVSVADITDQQNCKELPETALSPSPRQALCQDWGVNVGASHPKQVGGILTACGAASPCFQAGGTGPAWCAAWRELLLRLQGCPAGRRKSCCW